MPQPLPASISATWAHWLQNRSNHVKHAILGCVDFLVLVVAVLAAYALRISDFALPPTDRLPLYLVAPVISVGVTAFAGIYHASMRSYSGTMERDILLSQLVVPLIWALFLLAFGKPDFARSTVLIYPALAILAMIGVRRLAAWFMNKHTSKTVVPLRERIPIAVFGAGPDGQQLVQYLRNQGRYQVVAIFDTDYSHVDRTVSGVRVYSSEQLEEIQTRHRLKELVIAKRGLSRSYRRRLTEMAIAAGLQVKIMPDIQDVNDGQFKLSDLKAVSVEDLLGRDPVPPVAALMEKAIRGQTVLVSGAGGSIGSELARQVLANGPRRLLLVENNEFSLFEIHRELEPQSLARKIELIPLLADIGDKPIMLDIMQRQQVSIVFHAAAYKHVRMVQENPLAGIHNNVWGTKTLADCAVEAGVSRFIMVSTDKAVRPTSVMGASKRVAEMYIQTLAKQQSDTVFSMVRFGNVLGSAGSVVPLFREQIAKGGPILVTHPDVTRYFMLIPEAAQLVIQAGAMAQGGEVFVLEMGEPIKITSLAKAMVELAGLSLREEKNPDGDIEMKFIGLRDGEKLYEELRIGRDIVATSHPRIMLSHEVYMEPRAFAVQLTALDKAIGAKQAVAAVKKLFELAQYGAEQD